MSNWVEREAKKNSRNLLIVSVPCVAIIVVLLVAVYDEANRKSDYTSVVVLGALLLFALWGCFLGMRRLSEMQVTPLWRQVALYGDVGQIAAQVDQELQMEAVKYRMVTLTRSWIVRRGPFKTWVSPLGDLAWAYKKVTRTYTNAIPTGKYYSAVIANRHRQRVEVSMSQKKTDALLADLAARVPWAFYGHSKELADAWKKDPATIVAAVDSRYRDFMAKSSAAKSST